MHAYETTIRLRHTDAAGVMFFARLFELAHRAFEDLLDHVEHPLPEDLAGADVAYPIVHASADYRQPLRLGNRVRVDVDVLEVRDRSFRLGYRFTLADGREAATATTVHAAVGRGVREKATLPDALVASLRALKGGGSEPAQP
jgi:1,4-dihydroxy-2-naphthoyl-CoA hydrolase